MENINKEKKLLEAVDVGFDTWERYNVGLVIQNCEEFLRGELTFDELKYYINNCIHITED